MTESPATDQAQVIEGSSAPEADPPAEGTNSAASPDLASPATEETAAIGDKETGTPPASDPVEPERKPKPDRVKELLAERNYWREQAIKGQPAQPAAPVEPAVPEGPPTLEQHGYDTEKWSQAYAQWSRVDAARVVRQELEKVEQQKQAQTIAQSFAEREAAFAAVTPDYVDVVSNPELASLATPVISEAIVSGENGAALSYYLGTHLEELAAISRKSPTQQAIAIGRLEAKLANAPASPAAAPPVKKAVQQTRAPAPPSPVNSANGSSIDPNKLNPDDWMKWRNAELAARRR